jgi:HprK-related kinase A
MIVADLSAAALRERLSTGRLRVRTGPVVSAIRSTLPSVHSSIARLYAHHKLEDDDGFADFHLAVERASGLRGWIAPQVLLDFDGEPAFAPLPLPQGFPLLEWGLNWCVSSHCVQYLVLHAAVLARDDRALLLPAPSGSGKSTLCAALVYGGGWRLLSDELALIEPANGRLVPIPRPVSLKNESIDLLRRFAPEVVFGDEVRDTKKGRIAHVCPPLRSVQLDDQRALPAWVVMPHYVADAPAALTPASRARTFMTLIDNAFNYDVHGRQGFAALAALIDRSACYRFEYSELREAVATFDALAKVPA